MFGHWLLLCTVPCQPSVHLAAIDGEGKRYCQACEGPPLTAMLSGYVGIAVLWCRPGTQGTPGCPAFVALELVEGLAACFSPHFLGLPYTGLTGCGEGAWRCFALSQPQCYRYISQLEQTRQGHAKSHARKLVLEVSALSTTSHVPL